MDSSRSMATSTSDVIVTPEKLFEAFLQVVNWIERTHLKGAGHGDHGNDFLVTIKHELARSVIMLAPDTLRLAALYQGTGGWLQDLDDLGGLHFSPEKKTDTYQLDDAFIKASRYLKEHPEEWAEIQTRFAKKQTPVRGAPFGGCFVGFPSKEIYHLITNDLVMVFDLSAEKKDIDAIYHSGEWVQPSSVEVQIYLSMIQVINLAQRQAFKYTSFNFKRATQRLAKKHGLEMLRQPPVYVFPKKLEPPQKVEQALLKVPGLRGSTTSGISVVQSHQTVAERFLDLQHHIQEVVRKRKDQTNPIFADMIQGLRRARLFDIPMELYLSFYHQADRYTTEQVAGFEWEARKEDEDWSSDRMTSMDFVQCVSEAGEHLALPEQLPFDCFYFGYNPPLTLTETMYSMYHLEELTDIVKHASLIGHLVVDDKVVTCLQIRYYNGRYAYSCSLERVKGAWSMPYTLAPWIVVGLIDWVNDHQTIIQDGTKDHNYRREAKKLMKDIHLKRDAPPAYYTVYMRDLVINKSVRKTFTSRFKKIIDWSHRWEVRGHYMVRVKRGALPLDPKLEKVLRKRKYQLFLDDAQIPFDVWQKLEARGVPPKKANEWLAVLISFRQDFVKGPEDKPLVPSVRKSARYAEENNEASVFDDQDIDETTQ